MLVALFAVAVFAAIMNAMLSAGIAYAQVIARQRAQRASTAALADGERILRAAIATQIQGGLGDGVPAPIPQATTAPSRSRSPVERTTRRPAAAISRSRCSAPRASARTASRCT
jgi:hypothetical protein